MSTSQKPTPVMDTDNLISFIVEFEEWWLRPVGNMSDAVAELLGYEGIKNLPADQAQRIADALNGLMYSVTPDKPLAYAELLRANGITVNVDEEALR